MNTLLREQNFHQNAYIFVLVIQSEKQAAGFLTLFIHALEVFLAAIPGRQSLHQDLILRFSAAWQRMGVFMVP